MTNENQQPQDQDQIQPEITPEMLIQHHGTIDIPPDSQVTVFAPFEKPEEQKPQ